MAYCKICGTELPQDSEFDMCDSCSELYIENMVDNLHVEGTDNNEDFYYDEKITPELEEEDYKTSSKSSSSSSTGVVVVAIILGIVFSGVLAYFYVDNNVSLGTSSNKYKHTTTTTAVTYTVEDYAYEASKNEIKKVLTSPSSASFSSRSNSIVKKDGEGYEVKLWCDAENIYGTKIRSYWIVFFDHVTAKNDTGSCEYRLTMTPQRFDDYDMWSKF